MLSLHRNTEALVLATAVFFFIIIIIFGLFSYFFIQMLIQNIIPIAIAIVMIICLPIVVKGWYAKRTGGDV